jgi:hypothetical protein
MIINFSSEVYMSLFVVTVKDSANADSGRMRINRHNNAISDFLVNNEMQTVYNWYYRLLLSISIISGILGTAVPLVLRLKSLPQGMVATTLKSNALSSLNTE